MVILVPNDDIEDISNDFYAFDNEVYGRNKKFADVDHSRILTSVKYLNG